MVRIRGRSTASTAVLSSRVRELVDLLSRLAISYKSAADLIDHWSGYVPLVDQVCGAVADERLWYQLRRQCENAYHEFDGPKGLFTQLLVGLEGLTETLPSFLDQRTGLNEAIVSHGQALRSLAYNRQDQPKLTEALGEISSTSGRAQQHLTDISTDLLSNIIETVTELKGLVVDGESASKRS